LKDIHINQLRESWTFYQISELFKSLAETRIP
jgi:hypothetical protein